MLTFEGKYDGAARSPKLLPCSHTVCLQCLERIAEEKTIKCPVCREVIPIPASGLSGIPPAFLVNQLLEMMDRQKRDLVSRCNSHPDQELAFCETCHLVFCPTCKGW